MQTEFVHEVYENLTGRSGVVECIVSATGIDAGWLWVLDQYPVIESVSGDDGRVTVRLVVTSDRWLERLMLRLGRHGAIESPDELRSIGADAARRVLARYDRT